MALEGASESGAQVELLDLRKLNLPMYQPRVTEPSANVKRLIEATAGAHGMIWSGPMYHGTISGLFKNAVDWLDLLRSHEPPFLTDKIIGLVSTAGGMQGLQVVNTMEFSVRALRAWAVPLVMPIAQAWKAFDAQGRPKDPKIEEQLHLLGREVVRAARQFAVEGLCDYSTPR